MLGYNVELIGHYFSLLPNCEKVHKDQAKQNIMKCIAPMVETISHGRYSNVGLASASVTFRCKSVRHFEFSKFEILTSTVIVVKFCALVQKFAQIRQFIVCGVIAKMLFQIWRLSTYRTSKFSMLLIIVSLQSKSATTYEISSKLDYI